MFVEWYTLEEMCILARLNAVEYSELAEVEHMFCQALHARMHIYAGQNAAGAVCVLGLSAEILVKQVSTL